VSDSIQFDFSGVDLFLAYLNGHAALEEVLEHPAYQAVRLHMERFSNLLSARERGGQPPVPAGFTAEDVEKALKGKRSPFHGLEGLEAKLPGIKAFLKLLWERSPEWSETIQQTLAGLLPEETGEITVYPILGYDMGIGLNGAACLNLNCEAYLDEPEEFLFYAIHECIHVVYERHHHIAPLRQVTSPAEWRSYFNLWVQNEGYAVYAPLKLRMERGRLNERDYRVLFEAEEMAKHRRALVRILDRFDRDQSLSPEQYLKFCFGPRRLTYRVGADLIRRIEQAEGLEAVRQAFYLEADEFMRSNRHLLKE
jgi:hypothetical protein